MTIINASDAAAISSRKAVKPELVRVLKGIFNDIKFNAEHGLFQASANLSVENSREVIHILESLEYNVTGPKQLIRGASHVVVVLSWEEKADVYKWEVLKEALSDDQKPAT